VFADVADGPLAHLPSGSFPANAAWLACAGISHNLLRAAGSLASLTHAKPEAPRCGATSSAAPAALPATAAGTSPCTCPQDWHRETGWMTLQRRLRTARRSGLTSPDPVTASLPSARPPGHPQIPGTHPWTSRRKVGGR
jgi:hypothetical protein